MNSARSIRASSIRALESLNNRGLIVGTHYEVGDAYRGIWGVYGSFDYLAPELFQISSTALMLGTTAQWRLSPSVVLQGHVSGGTGYTATTPIEEHRERVYNYGLAPQGLWSLRVLFGNKAALELTGRGYRAGRFVQRQGVGKDNISRVEAGLTFRLQGRHGVTLRYIHSNRDSNIAVLGERHQRRDTVGIYYTLLGSEDFGAVRW